MGCAAAAALLSISALGANASEIKSWLDIPSQSLEGALKEFGVETNSQVLFAKDAVVGRTSVRVKGVYSPREALALLTKDSGLRVEQSAESVFLVKSDAAGAAPSATPAAAGDAPAETPAGAPAEAEKSADAPSSDVEKVTVTGSRIRGAKQASPVLTLTPEQMRKQGHTDLGQVVRALPQNFNGGQNPEVGVLAGGIGNQNMSGGSSLNLRGLGQDATLTLLNGQRLPYDGFTQATDVAVIPIAAISRMEVLLDGASAIYGSDAVGGVANIVLKQDYDGAEISVRYGGATQGGYEQQQYTGVAGQTWSTGGFIVTADYNKYTGVTASQRDFLSYMPPTTSIYPEATTWGVLFSGHQKIGERAELSVDAFYTNRTGGQYFDYAALGGYAVGVDRDSTIWGIAPTLRFDLGDDWSAKVFGAIGENEADVLQVGITPTNVVVFSSDACECNKAKSLGAEIEGPLFSLPGGDARVALGVGYRENTFSSINNATGVTGTGGDGASRFAYGEIYLPLVSAEQNIPLVYKFEVSGAARYENYDHFGDSTTPKVGAIWGLSSDIDLKATWGKSFKVPTLLQQYQDIILDLFPAVQFGPYAADEGVLFMQGGNRDLMPEKAETVTTGFVLHPDFIPGLNVEVSWFDIDYTDRIVHPFATPGTALIDPVGFEFVVFNPTVAQQNAAFATAGQVVGSFPQGTPPPPVGPYDPARVVAIVDMRYVNSASQHIKGVDLTGTYTMDLFGGSFTTSANATWLEIQQALTTASAEKTLSGHVFYSPEFRGRIGGSWSADGWTLSATVNHTAGVINDMVPPGTVKGDGMTTLDLVADYVVASPFGGGELELNLGVQNVFDKEPPYMQPLYPILANYDSTNYSALGRVVNLTVTQRY